MYVRHATTFFEILSLHDIHFRHYAPYIFPTLLILPVNYATAMLLSHFDFRRYAAVCLLMSLLLMHNTLADAAIREPLLFIRFTITPLAMPIFHAISPPFSLLLF